MKFSKSLFVLIALSILSLTSNAQTDAVKVRFCCRTPEQNEPLWVMVFKNKSFELDSSKHITFINPNAIEKLNVFKGAQATSIYGYKAANGVIVIQIKRAHAKKEYKRLKPYLYSFR